MFPCFCRRSASWTLPAGRSWKTACRPLRQSLTGSCRSCRPPAGRSDSTRGSTRAPSGRRSSRSCARSTTRSSRRSTTSWTKCGTSGRRVRTLRCVCWRRASRASGGPRRWSRCARSSRPQRWRRTRSLSQHWTTSRGCSTCERRMCAILVYRVFFGCS